MDFYEMSYESFCASHMNDVGKMVICKCKNDGDTRLFLHRANTFVTAATKEGWWDIFTISSEKCNTGYYIGEITKVKRDANGWLNYVVSPRKFLGDKIEEDSDVWNLFVRGEIFAIDCDHRPYHGKGNIQAAIEEYEDEFKVFEKTHKESQQHYLHQVAARFFFEKFLNDELSMVDIENLLDLDSCWERTLLNICKNLSTKEGELCEKYPLLTKKVNNNGCWKNITSFHTYLLELRLTGIKLGICTYGEEPIYELMDICEKVLQHYEDKKAAEKAARKAAKKAKKNNT